MRLILIITITVLMAATSSCVRLPNGYHVVMDRAAESNDAILKQIDSVDTTEQKLQILRTVIEEDNKTFRAIAETIRQGGGK